MQFIHYFDLVTYLGQPVLENEFVKKSLSIISGKLCSVEISASIFLMLSRTVKKKIISQNISWAQKLSNEL